VSTHDGSYPFLKGHGTQNDFVLLPDEDGQVHGELSPERVRALCDRRAGIGADGVLRVIRADALRPGESTSAEWFMDYRNGDGSISEMCGNGIRVFARHLIQAGLVAGNAGIPIGTRDGVLVVSVDSSDLDLLTVEMGTPDVLGESVVGLGQWSWPARHVATGNPHAVVFVDSLADLGDIAALTYDAATYPAGVNVEFVERRGAQHIKMRVLERGVGGGRLSVRWAADGRLFLTGPAVIVAAGSTDL
jgi:diaminopimelate epimerase